jgi:hypothetical protein
MGLTIHYSLLARGSDAHARNLVQALHQAAHDLPFQELGDIVELSGDECDFKRRDQEDPLRWLLIQAIAYPELESGTLSVPPPRVIGFTAVPGDGCEESNFGLCTHPRTIRTDEELVATRLTGWRWRSHCKTQYASNPERGGVKNFLQCHLSIVAMLDRARELGCLERVSDEGRFWEKRDVKALVAEIGSWNEMIAAFGGKLKDLLDDQVEMEIARFPNFEQLEAAGHQQLARSLERVRKPGRERQCRRKKRA